MTIYSHMHTYDLIVLGGGRASALAIAGAKAGKKVALIESDQLGGVCPNRGCVPSKLLIGFSEAARRVRRADRHFIDAEFRGIDTPRVFERVNEWIAGIDPLYEARLLDAGVHLLRGIGKFTAHKKIEVAGTAVNAETIVVATGSRPTNSPFATLPVWTSDDLFPLKDPVPKSIIIIGGGFIGCELGAFFSGIGVETRLFARGGRLLSKADAEIEAIFQPEFGNDVHVHLNSLLNHLDYDGSEFAATFIVHEGREETYRAERVLFAVGRVPNTEKLALEMTGLFANKHGFLAVDNYLETSVPGIYAAGDVNGRFMLQHAASYEVHYLNQRLIKGVESGPIDERLVAHAIYSHPEVASIGFTEEQLIQAGTPYIPVVNDWLASARAMAARLDYPRTKLLVSPIDYSILGCHLIGPEASTLLHQVLAVMRLKNDVRELAEMIYVHPALNECLMAAAVRASSLVRKAREKDSTRRLAHL